jgi:hypothetical protein
MHLAREIYDAHTAATKLAVDRISTGESLLKREEEGIRERLRHREKTIGGALPKPRAGGILHAAIPHAFLWEIPS